MWSEEFAEGFEPSMDEIKSYIGNSMFEKLTRHIESTYSVSPVIEYSSCPMQKGWNIKYKKSGRSLCTLYPMKGFFIALVVIGAKQQNETELLLPSFSGYVRNLYEKTPFSLGGRWLMIEVKDASVLKNVTDLIEIRVKNK